MNDYDEKQLERIKGVFRTMLSEEMVGDFEVGLNWDALSKTFQMKIVQVFYALLDSSEKVPLDWWQAFRLRWLPSWWLDRHPIRWRKIRVYQSVYFKPSDDPFWEQRFSKTYKEDG